MDMPSPFTVTVAFTPEAEKLLRELLVAVRGSDHETQERLLSALEGLESIIEAAPDGD